MGSRKNESKKRREKEREENGEEGTERERRGKEGWRRKEGRQKVRQEGERTERERILVWRMGFIKKNKIETTMHCNEWKLMPYSSISTSPSTPSETIIRHPRRFFFVLVCFCCCDQHSYLKATCGGKSLLDLQITVHHHEKPRQELKQEHGDHGIGILLAV